MRYLIDLTDLEKWNGNHGGTQRVVYGIAKQLYLQHQAGEKNVEFIAFSSKDKSYYKTSFDPIIERVEQQKARGALTPTAGVPPRQLTARIKHKIKPYIPESIKRNQAVRQKANKVLAVSIKAAKLGRQKMASYRRLPNNTTKNAEPVVFSQQDFLLILGKPWDEPSIQEALYKYKKQANFKIAQVVYDLIIPLNPQLHHPSLFKVYTQNLFQAISISDLLLPISQSSLKDLKLFAKRLNLELPGTKVVRLAEEIVEQIDGEGIKPDPRIADKFIACVGTFEIRKNHALLYYAYKLGLSQDIDLPQLLIVGGRGWLSDNFQYLIENDPAIKQKIIILDNVNDVSLDWIYRNCLFTVYPSLYEGWGLPVAESLAYGKLCVSSNSSSMPEIAGDLIDYFSPYDAAECLAKINLYLKPSNLSAKQKLIQSNYKITTWRQTTKQIEDAVNKYYE